MLDLQLDCVVNGFAKRMDAFHSKFVSTVTYRISSTSAFVPKPKLAKENKKLPKIHLISYDFKQYDMHEHKYEINVRTLLPSNHDYAGPALCQCRQVTKKLICLASVIHYVVIGPIVG